MRQRSAGPCKQDKKKKVENHPTRKERDDNQKGEVKLTWRRTAHQSVFVQGKKDLGEAGAWRESTTGDW